MKAYLKNKLAALAVLALAAPAAFAGSTSSGDTSNSSDAAFQEFYDTVKGWTSGTLGMGLATTMLLMGGAIGVAKNSPMPALTGIAGAAFLKWGPDIIVRIMNGGLI